MAEKTCGRCKNTKPVAEFRLVTDKRMKQPLTYHCSVCKECERVRALEKYNQNKEKYQTQNKLYKQQFPEKINETRRKYTQLKMLDFKERLKRNMKSLLANKITKRFSTKEYLGTSFEIIQEWFEFNFQEGMTWDNYGSYWHVDHTIPINLFNLDDAEHTLICFNWMNLMPLEKTKNLQKSDKLSMPRVFYQEIQLVKFAKQKNLQVQDFLKKYANILRDIL